MNIHPCPLTFVTALPLSAGHFPFKRVQNGMRSHPLCQYPPVLKKNNFLLKLGHFLKRVPTHPLWQYPPVIGTAPARRSLPPQRAVGTGAYPPSRCYSESILVLSSGRAFPDCRPAASKRIFPFKIIFKMSSFWSFRVGGLFRMAGFRLVFFLFSSGWLAGRLKAYISY